MFMAFMVVYDALLLLKAIFVVYMVLSVQIKRLLPLNLEKAFILKYYYCTFHADFTIYKKCPIRPSQMMSTYYGPYVVQIAVTIF